MCVCVCVCVCIYVFVYVYIYIYSLWKSDLTDKMKCSFFQAAVVSILLYGCITWTLTKRMEKSLTSTTQECCKQYWTSPGGSTPQSSSCTATYHPSQKTILGRRTRHAGHCWRSKDELISDVLLWTPSHGRAKAERPARIYIQQVCADTGWGPEDLPEAMDDTSYRPLQERVRDIRADCATWWWYRAMSRVFANGPGDLGSKNGTWFCLA